MKNDVRGAVIKSKIITPLEKVQETARVVPCRMAYCKEVLMPLKVQKDLKLITSLELLARP